MKDRLMLPFMEDLMPHVRIKSQGDVLDPDFLIHPQK